MSVTKSYIDFNRSCELSDRLTSQKPFFDRILRYWKRLRIRKNMGMEIYLTGKNKEDFENYTEDLCEWGGIPCNYQLLGFKLRDEY